MKAKLWLLVSALSYMAEASPLVPSSRPLTLIGRQMQPGESSNANSRHPVHSSETESAISGLFASQIQLSTPNRHSRGSESEDFQISAKVLSKLSPPEQNAKKLTPDEQLQAYGNNIHLRGAPIFLDSESPSVSQLKVALAHYKTFYYSYDKPGDFRGTSIIDLYTEGRLVMRKPLPVVDAEVKGLIAKASWIGTRYGNIARALQYGIPFSSKYREFLAWKNSPAFHLDKDKNNLKTLRDILDSFGSVQLIDSTSDAALRFRLNADSKVESFVKYLSSGEVFILATGEKIRR